MTVNKVVIKEVENPTDGYKYNVEIWRSVDGKNFFYTGDGKFFRSLADAENYTKMI